MSSKSRKHSDKSKKARAQRPAAQAAPATPAPSSEKHAGGGFDIPDEILHAPQETSKLRFALMIGLVIVLLIIFIIPGALIGGAGRASREDPVAISWELPSGERVEVTETEFVMTHRALADGVRVDPTFARVLGLGMADRQPSRIQAARAIVLDGIARDAGIAVTDDDLVAHLTRLRDARFNGDAEMMKAYFQQYPGVEETLRTGLRIQRFLQLTAYAGAVPSPEAILEAWNTDHTEVAFDYVVAQASSFEDAARAELPDDDELEAWLDEKPDWEVRELMSPERRSAQVAIFRDASSTPAAGLLAAYPPEEAEPEAGAEGGSAEVSAPPTDEERALEYYDEVFTRRFLEETEEGEPTEFLGFEEVKQACLVESRVYAALKAWLADLTERQGAGEEVDFVAEATELGLGLVEVDEATRDELLEHEDLGDLQVVNAIYTAATGAFGYAVSVTDDVLAVVRVTGRVEPTLPPFEEIRDEVAEMWIGPRSLELATAALEDLWVGFATFTPEEDEPFPFFANQEVRRRTDADTFRSATEAAGFEVHRRDWHDRSERIQVDDPEEDPEGVFFQRNPQLPYMAVDEVAEPLPGPALPGGERETAYLVRHAGEREVPLERMSPGDYEAYKTRARNQATLTLNEAWDLDFLVDQFGLAHPGIQLSPPDEEGEEGEEAPAEEPAE